MMIAPVIFCTIVLGIGSVRKAATVGKVGGLAFVYFLVMSTFALAIGLVVGNLIHPGSGMHLSESSAGKGAELAEKAHESGGLLDFVQGIIPDTLFSSLTAGSVLQALFVALLVGFALQAMGNVGEPILRGVEYLQKLVFKVLVMILWLAPIGAFGAIAALVGASGWSAMRLIQASMCECPTWPSWYPLSPDERIASPWRCAFRTPRPGDVTSRPWTLRRLTRCRF